MSQHASIGAALVAGALMTGGAAFADTFYVPDHYATIQAAIDGVDNGDEIGVRPGTYGEAIDFRGQEIRLYSTDGPEVTTIDGTGLAAAVVTCRSGEGQATVLEGFTITGGTGTFVGDLDITLGGGMLIVESSPRVRDCTFEHNTAEAGGGLAVIQHGDPSIESCTFENNEATRSTALPDIGGGGGVLVHEAAATVTGCVFTTNQAFDGAGMTAMASHTHITGSTFQSNTSANGAGALLNYEGEIDLRDSVFRANRAVGHGGGFIDNSGERAVITGCDFIGNTAGLSTGGALLWYTERASVSDCLFQENVAEVYPGGGLAAGYTTASVDDCRFYDNSAGNVGGGLAFTPEGALTVTSCEFSGNHAPNGGGLSWAVNTGSFVIVASTFTDNTAVANGGGMLLEGGERRVTGCLLAGNSASNGGAIRSWGGSTGIVATTIMDNAATASGGGLYNCCSAQVTICGSVLWGNTEDQIANWSGATTAATYTDVQGGHAGVGNLDVDPLCADPANGDYRLLPESACIDAGANNALPADEFDLDDDGDTKERLPLDLDGNYRFADLDSKADTGCGAPVVVDMGAYELQGDPVHPVLIGDVDGNGFVDFADLLEILGGWGTCEVDCCLGDVNFDWEVNFADLLAILSNWS